MTNTYCSACNAPFVRCWCYDCCEGAVRSRCCHARKKEVEEKDCDSLFSKKEVHLMLVAIQHVNTYGSPTGWVHPEVQVLMDKLEGLLKKL